MNNRHGEWFFSPQSSTSKGIFLVCHGLNLRPQKMNYICQYLNHLGYNVYNIYLEGHRNSDEDLRAITRYTWLENIRNAFNEVKSFKEFTATTPVYYFGFSIGALLLLDFLLLEEFKQPSNTSMEFKKWFFIAPGFAIRTSVVTILSQLYQLHFPFRIPSLSHKGYQVHSALPLSIYKNLIDSYQAVQQASSTRKIDIPTQVYIDPKDEFISHKEVALFIRKKNLNHWNLLVESKDKSTLFRYPHHLLIDKESGVDTILQKITYHLS